MGVRQALYISTYDRRLTASRHGPLGIVRCIGGIPKSVAAERRKRREEKVGKNAGNQSSETPTEKKKKKEKEAEKQKQKQEAEKRKQEEEAQKQIRNALEWNKAVKRVREQEEPPEEPDAKRKKMISVLEAVSNREMAVLTQTDEDEDAGDPMDWSVQIS